LTNEKSGHTSAVYDVTSESVESNDFADSIVLPNKETGIGVQIARTKGGNSRVTYSTKLDFLQNVDGKHTVQPDSGFIPVTISFIVPNKMDETQRDAALLGIRAQLEMASDVLSRTDVPPAAILQRGTFN
jgi:hypothetical protein